MITVNNVHNVAPSITTTGGAMGYTENAAATAIDPGLTITDPDDVNLTGTEVRISSGFDATQDTLSFTDQGSITGSYDATTGIMTLTRLRASLTTYRDALRTVKYNRSDNPTTSPP